MDDGMQGFFIGFFSALFCILILFLTPLVGCRSDFEREAIGNGCGKLICDTNGACEFEWTCD